MCGSIDTSGDDVVDGAQSGRESPRRMASCLQEWPSTYHPCRGRDLEREARRVEDQVHKEKAPVRHTNDPVLSRLHFMSIVVIFIDCRSL